jgi:nitrogen-specific signal transduction histidine kinase
MGGEYTGYIRSFRGARDLPQSAEEIVLALCHEVGNLVGAIRLNADAIDAEASAVELAEVSVEIDDASARIRSLLALVRPLLAPGDRPGAPARAIVAGVREALEEYGGRRVRIEVRADSDLPAVPGPPETLHHLLLSFVCYAVEGARPSGRVLLSARRDGARVSFSIEDDGREDPGLGEPGGAPPTGRALLCAIAHRILARSGGEVRALRDGGTTRIELRLPAA